MRHNPKRGEPTPPSLADMAFSLSEDALSADHKALLEFYNHTIERILGENWAPPLNAAGMHTIGDLMCGFEERKSEKVIAALGIEQAGDVTEYLRIKAAEFLKKSPRDAHELLANRAVLNLYREKKRSGS